MYPIDTLRRSLAYKHVIEYPTIYVTLAANESKYPLKTFDEKKRKLDDTDLAEENENKRQKVEGEDANNNFSDIDEADSEDQDDNQNGANDGHENIEEKQQKAVNTFLNFLEAFPFNWNNAPQELFTVEEETAKTNENKP